MKFRYLTIVLTFLITMSSVFAATQSHPVSQIGTNLGEQNSDLNLGSHGLFADNISQGSRFLSLLSISSNIFGLSLGSGGLTCTACVTTTDILDSAITSIKIGNKEVKNSNLDDNSVTSNKIAPKEVRNSNLDDNAVTTDKIQDGTIATSDLGNNIVTAAKIDSSQVQKRVSTVCNVGDAITSINSDGTAVCASAGVPVDIASGQPLDITHPTAPAHQVLSIIANGITSGFLSSDFTSLIKISGGVLSSDGTNLKLVNNGCIQNSAGVCRISFDSNGNIIINV